MFDFRIIRQNKKNCLNIEHAELFFISRVDSTKTFNIDFLGYVFEQALYTSLAINNDSYSNLSRSNFGKLAWNSRCYFIQSSIISRKPFGYTGQNVTQTICVVHIYFDYTSILLNNADRILSGENLKTTLVQNLLESFRASLREA